MNNSFWYNAQELEICWNEIYKQGTSVEKFAVFTWNDDDGEISIHQLI